MSDLTQEKLKELLTYDPEIGIFTWNVSRGRKVRPGDKAGTLRKDGYFRIQIDGKLYYSHRLAWLYVYGRIPELQVDHINQDRSDNRIENLREVTYSENNQNKPMRKDSTTGFRGVSFHKKLGKYVAHIGLDSKLYYLGIFSTAEKASQAYEDAAEKLHTRKPLEGDIK